MDISVSPCFLKPKTDECGGNNKPRLVSLRENVSTEAGKRNGPVCLQTFFKSFTITCLCRISCPFVSTDVECPNPLQTQSRIFSYGIPTTVLQRLQACVGVGPVGWKNRGVGSLGTVFPFITSLSFPLGTPMPRVVTVRRSV